MTIANRQSAICNTATGALSALNFVEGVSHAATAMLGFWGLLATRVHDLRLAIPVFENAVWALVSFGTGLFLLTKFRAWLFRRAGIEEIRK